MRKKTFFILTSLVVTGVCVFFASFTGNKSEIINQSLLNGNPLDAKNLPLGDGRISSIPKKNYVMSCQNSFYGFGAFKDGEWIHTDGTWDSTAKAEVDGDVMWKNFKYEIKVENGKRKLIGNGLPNHQTGIFPIQPADDAYKYDRNPNHINEINIIYDLPILPQIANSPSCVPMGAIGVLKNGVVIFNSLDAQGKDAAAHEIQDKCDGHPEIEGQYHYHSLSKCIAEKASNKHSELVGYALDGFGIFGIFGENGKELTNNDLDECHGHTHEVLWDGKPTNLYHYHATKEYPYTVGCFKGTPVLSKNN
jgi:YHYH protein